MINFVVDFYFSAVYSCLSLNKFFNAKVTVETVLSYLLASGFISIALDFLNIVMSALVSRLFRILDITSA